MPSCRLPPHYLPDNRHPRRSALTSCASLLAKEEAMSDRTAAPAATGAPNGVADTTVEAYVATWNETDAARRQAGIARAWAPDARYRDPLMASDGHAGIDAMLALSEAEGLASVQARFPGFV